MIRPFWMCMHLIMISSFHLLVLMDTFSFATESLCHDDESSALLQLKQSFLIDVESAASGNPPTNYSKVDTWEHEGDCCRWDGVECDVGTGHVIGLDLSSSLLSGSLDPATAASTLFSLVHLRTLNLAYNSFNYSRIPSEISNLSSLSALNLSASDFSGIIPASLGTLTELTLLDLSQNHFEGQVPSSISELKNLEFLDLSYNNFNGSVHADIFLNLKNLSQIRLSDNSITLLTNNTMNTSLPVFRYVGLDSCNLSEFPEFLRFQAKLEILTLVNNRIQQMPGWMRNGNNGTTRGSDQEDPVVLPWPSLRIFDLRDNMLQGSLPIPPPNISGYLVSNSRLTGEIPPVICRLNLLALLDLSNNSMSGTIPPCLTSDSLVILNLKGNKFSGTIPQAYTNGCRLTQVDLSQNQITGSLPQSLANCKKLEILILAENQLHGTFPIWLAVLPSLQVLILRSNNFYGEIRSPTIDSEFPKVRIIDLSNNSFTGNLPLGSSHSWNAMKMAYTPGQTYITSNGAVQVQHTTWRKSYEFSMTMTNKGVSTEYQKIYNIFTAIDLSGNNFGGEIPESLGNLQGLQVLNLYNNELTGGIPASIGNLTQLESLDISQNKLSGNIPPQMRELTKLSFFNVSFNRLVGPIPQSTQFSTFDNDSYMDNLALCGYPLSRKCGELPGASPFQPPTTNGDDDSEFPTRVDWLVIFSGVLGGLLAGLFVGHTLTKTHQEWFDEKAGNISVVLSQIYEKLSY